MDPSALHSLLDDAQRSQASHRRVAAAMRVMRREHPADFPVALLRCVNRVLVLGRREPATERVVALLVRVACDSDDDDGATAGAAGEAGGDAADGGAEAADDDSEEAPPPLSLLLLAYLLQHHGAADKAVRFRVTQMTAGIVNGLPEDTELSDELYEAFADAMLERSKDRAPAVRVQAVAALSRLQDVTGHDDDPADDERDSDDDAEDEEGYEHFYIDPVVARLVSLTTRDPAKDVRKAALQALAVTPRTVAKIVSRAHDVRGDVRRTAFLVVAKNVPRRMLTGAQMARLLESGLADRSTSVKKAAGELLAAWVADIAKRQRAKSSGSGSGSNPVAALLAAIGPVEHEAACLAAARAACVSRAVLAVEGVPQPEDIADIGPAGLAACDVAEAIYWRACCEKIPDQDTLPTLTEFCTALEALGAEDADPHVARQFMAMARCLDVAEEAGRRKLAGWVTGLLASLPRTSVAPAAVPDFVRTALATLRRVVDDTCDDDDDDEDSDNDDDGQGSGPNNSGSKRNRESSGEIVKGSGIACVAAEICEDLFPEEDGASELVHSFGKDTLSGMDNPCFIIISILLF
jgi:hypothetical protein